MVKADDYRLAIENCIVRAKLSPYREIRQLWEHIQGDYEYLSRLDTSAALAVELSKNSIELSKNSIEIAEAAGPKCLRCGNLRHHHKRILDQLTSERYDLYECTECANQTWSPVTGTK
jgi:hypothetical protein